jgi:L-iditol 2-dehydrogenase
MDREVNICVQQEFEISLMFMDMQIDLRYLFRYKSTWPAAIRLASTGRLNLEALVTHTFSSDDFLDAFKTVMDPDSGAVKVIVRSKRHSLAY